MFEPKLKPCPFCGKIPNRYVKVRRGMSHDCINLAVICRNCDIRKELSVMSGSSFEQILEAFNETTKLWNKRANESEGGDSS